MSTSRRRSITEILNAGSTTATPPIANLQIVSPVHYGCHPEPLIGRGDGVLRYPTAGPIVNESFLVNEGWFGIHAFVFRYWRVQEREFSVHFQYTPEASPDDVITPKSWLAQPERFELLDDESECGRCVRIYAFFTPRPRSQPATLQTIDCNIPPAWWMSRIWQRPPSWYGNGRGYPGSGSVWVARTGARPPWLPAHTLPPMSSVWPDSGPPFPFGKLPIEIQELVCEELFSAIFEGLERSSDKLDWPPDRYLRRTPAILLVSKAVSDMALTVLYRQPLCLSNGPRRDCATAVVSSITHIVSPTLLGNLRFVELSHTGPVRSTSLRNFLIMAIAVVRIWTEHRMADMRRAEAPFSGGREKTVLRRTLKVDFSMAGVDGGDRWKRVRRNADELAVACAELTKRVVEPVTVNIGANAIKWHPHLWVKGLIHSSDLDDDFVSVFG
ncbi:hypothetical protein DBV05_g11629 [Lasiodiplodia theobromae]|uniref:Uncharacterized protein n=1 Tax=Lasiodiplodia theobromae TaxID=45133 RepID=A0A5N5CWG2_9PEZI|nr:hypothetical protein DBV05_g11629 [Lasiodiplodia theobromae]